MYTAVQELRIDTSHLAKHAQTTMSRLEMEIKLATQYLNFLDIFNQFLSPPLAKRLDISISVVTE